MELWKVKVFYVLIGGMLFYDCKEVCDILVYLWFFDCLEDEVVLFWIINMLLCGFG